MDERMTNPQLDSRIEGMLEARRMYAQAWVDATGRPLDPVEFTPKFVRAQIEGWLAMIEEARAEERERCAEVCSRRADEYDSQCDRASEADDTLFDFDCVENAMSEALACARQIRGLGDE